MTVCRSVLVTLDRTVPMRINPKPGLILVALFRAAKLDIEELCRIDFAEPGIESLSRSRCCAPSWCAFFAGALFVHFGDLTASAASSMA